MAGKKRFESVAELAEKVFGYECDRIPQEFCNQFEECPACRRALLDDLKEAYAEEVSELETTKLRTERERDRMAEELEHTLSELEEYEAEEFKRRELNDPSEPSRNGFRPCKEALTQGEAAGMFMAAGWLMAFADVLLEKEEAGHALDRGTCLKYEWTVRDVVSGLRKLSDPSEDGLWDE